MGSFYPGRQGGPLAGDFDGQGASTIDLISSGMSVQRAAGVATRTASTPGGFDLPWGSTGVGLVALVVLLLYLDGRILS